MEPLMRCMYYSTLQTETSSTVF